MADAKQVQAILDALADMANDDDDTKAAREQRIADFFSGETARRTAITHPHIVI